MCFNVHESCVGGRLLRLNESGLFKKGAHLISLITSPFWKCPARDHWSITCSLSVKFLPFITNEFYVTTITSFNTVYCKVFTLLNFVTFAEVVVSPPFVFLTTVKSELRSEIQVAAQNCWVKKGGAFTGEVRYVSSYHLPFFFAMFLCVIWYVLDWKCKGMIATESKIIFLSKWNCDCCFQNHTFRDLVSKKVCLIMIIIVFSLFCFSLNFSLTWNN